MSGSRVLLVAAVALLALAETPARAEISPRAAQLAQSTTEIVIDTVARRLIQDYYGNNYNQWRQEYGDDDDNDNDQGQGQGNKKKNKGKGRPKTLPPGLAKKGTLPPGLYNQLARNGELPPGLQREELPGDLLSSLPPLQPGYYYTRADDKVMLVEAATNLILDLLTVPAVSDLD